MRSNLRALVGGLLVSTALTGPAMAFTEVEVVPSAPGTSVAFDSVEQGPAVKPDHTVKPEDQFTQLPAFGFSDPAGASGGEQGGTELKIPGLGTIGVLPKLDFGLELLYGSPDPSADFRDERAPSRDALSEDDVLIRGILKHRF